MSNSLHRIRALLVVLVVVSGCQTRNPDYCEGAPLDHCDNIDAQTCSFSEQCPASAPICDVGGTGRCVECTASDSRLCSGTEPICGNDNTCRGCVAHSECAESNVCGPDGACIDASAVAYVAPAPRGSDNAQCTAAMPCTKMSNALATVRAFVKIGGTITESVTVENGRKVTFLADPDAKLTSSSGGAILTLRGDATSLAVYDLTIRDAPNPGGIGIVIPAAAGAPTIALNRVVIANNPGGGLSVTGGSLTISQSTISDNDGGGLIMNAIGVIVITNSFIHHNGDSSATSFGGFSLRPTSGSRVEFNTIVDNEANVNAASAGGVFCDTSGFVAANNIIFRNTGGPAGATQTFGNCTYGNSFNMAGASPSANPLNFVRPNERPFDYHLSPSSPSSVVGGAGSCSGFDFDGDVRPIGGMCDLGADELRQ